MFTKEPVELGQPNTLTCHVDKFFPPVLNVTWLRNGRAVTEGVAETIFLPSTEFRFHKFHYLTFVPSAEDVYDCRVEHWGLAGPLLGHWGTELRPRQYHPDTVSSPGPSLLGACSLAFLNSVAYCPSTQRHHLLVSNSLIFT